MRRKSLLLIINPTAGQKKRESMADIINVFSDAGYVVMIFYTRHRYHAKELVIQYGEDADLIVCMGGDGTLNETIAGICESGMKTPVGYIPAGSTNDFAASLSIPTDAVEAAKRIVEKTPRYLDVGSFGGRSFIYTASAGLFTSTSYDTPQEIKNLFGHFAYILNGIKDLSKVKRIHLSFSLADETVEDDYIFAAFCNTTSIGGIMNLDESVVDYADGLFELLLIKFPKDLIQLNQIIASLMAKEYNTELIRFCKVSSAAINNPASVDWSLDGEKEEGKTDAEFHVIRNTVSMVY